MFGVTISAINETLPNFLFLVSEILREARLPRALRRRALAMTVRIVVIAKLSEEALSFSF